MGSSGEEEEMMRRDDEKKLQQHEERETAMAAVGLVLLVAGAKHALASILVQQWRPLLVFLFLNLVLLAILFTSIRPDVSANKNPKNKKKKKNVDDDDDEMIMSRKKKIIKMKKTKTKRSLMTSRSSIHQVLEDYFCKTSTSDHQEEMTNSLMSRHNDERDDDEAATNNNSSKQQQQQEEDINARVEAFIVMFRQQLALDSLQTAGSRRQSTATFILPRRSTDQTQVSLDGAQQRPIP